MSATMVLRCVQWQGSTKCFTLVDACTQKDVTVSRGKVGPKQQGLMKQQERDCTAMKACRPCIALTCRGVTRASCYLGARVTAQHCQTFKVKWTEGLSFRVNSSKLMQDSTCMLFLLVIKTTKALLCLHFLCVCRSEQEQMTCTIPSFSGCLQGLQGAVPF